MPPPCRAATINSRQARQSHHADASVAAAVAAIFTVATAAANAAAAVNAVTTKFFFAKFRQDRCLAGLTYGGAPGGGSSSSIHYKYTALLFMNVKWSLAPLSGV